MKVYLENKFISIGGDSKVCDEQGNQLFFVDGKALSFTSKKLIKEMPSKKVLYIVKKGSVKSNGVFKKRPFLFPQTI